MGRLTRWLRQEWACLHGRHDWAQTIMLECQSVTLWRRRCRHCGVEVWDYAPRFVVLNATSGGGPHA